MYIVCDTTILFFQVLGNWTVSWEFQYEELMFGPPTVDHDDMKPCLMIQPRDPKKKVLGLFGGVTTKKINMPDKETARNLARIIHKTLLENAKS